MQIILTEEEYNKLKDQQNSKELARGWAKAYRDAVLENFNSAVSDTAKNSRAFSSGMPSIDQDIYRIVRRFCDNVHSAVKTPDIEDFMK